MKYSLYQASFTYEIKLHLIDPGISNKLVQQYCVALYAPLFFEE